MAALHFVAGGIQELLWQSSPSYSDCSQDSQAETSLWHKADVPCGRKLGLEQAPSAQRTALYFSALYWSFGRFSMSGALRREQWAGSAFQCCHGISALVENWWSQWYHSFASFSRLAPCLCMPLGFWGTLLPPFWKSFFPITHSDGWRWEVFWQPFFSNGDVCQEDSYLCTSQWISFLKWLFPAEEKIDSL